MALFGKQKQKQKPKTTSPPSSARGDQETASVGSKLTIKGKVSGSGNLVIMGRLEGDFDTAGELVVAPPAIVNGEVKASSISVSGTVTGNLTAADRIHLEKTAQVNGRMASGRISIADGAMFDGEIEMRRERREPPAEASKAKGKDKEKEKK